MIADTLRLMIAPNKASDTVVPPTGFTARLTVFAAGAMAFLAVFALALSVSTGRLAARWEAELNSSVTIRISAPADQVEAQTSAVLKVLDQTAGVASARALEPDEQRALLAPWFGPDVPLKELPLPRLVDVLQSPEGLDAAGLRLRLAAEAPGAVLDDHSRWRAPLVDAARALRMLGVDCSWTYWNHNGCHDYTGCECGFGGKRSGNSCAAACWCPRYIHCWGVCASLYAARIDRRCGRYSRRYRGGYLASERGRRRLFDWPRF